MNILSIDNHRAVVTYDPDTDMLRGEFLGLNVGADFYASDIPTPKAEGAKSLAAFLAVCKENGISETTPPAAPAQTASRPQE